MHIMDEKGNWMENYERRKRMDKQRDRKKVFHSKEG